MATRADDPGYLSGDRDQNGFDSSASDYYHGGDIAGLQQKLPFQNSRVFTSIWMTPVFENQPKIITRIAFYHGYWMINYLKIDPHLGQKEYGART